MKTIIALRGNKKTGKSTTMGILLDRIRKDDCGYKIILDKYRMNSSDFFVIVKKKGKLIGICSYGDAQNLIKERCDVFVARGCEIIVCACHPSGKTVDAVLSYVALGYTPEFYEKSIGEASNNSDAETLLQRIDTLIG